jgi:hypothetical protein
MRGFEDHCWRDVIDSNTAKIYKNYERELKIGKRPALLAIEPIKELLAFSRTKGIPVIYTTRASAFFGTPLITLPWLILIPMGFIR